MAVISIKNKTKSGSLLNGNAPYIPSDYESIQTVTVGSGGASSVTFSSIPSTYQHLQIRGIGRTNIGGASVLDNVVLQFNGVTTTTYDVHFLNGNGTSAGSGNSTTRDNAIFLRATGDVATSGSFGVAVCDILDYANTSKNKTIRSLSGYDNNGNGELFLWSGLWRNTAAISSITIFQNGNTANLVQYSSFALYGIKG